MRNKIIKYSNRKFIIYYFMEGEIDTRMVRKNRLETQLDLILLVEHFCENYRTTIFFLFN